MDYGGGRWRAFRETGPLLRAPTDPWVWAGIGPIDLLLACDDRCPARGQLVIGDHTASVQIP
jgi:hypothetical protein